jgi:hypothetical protein
MDRAMRARPEKIKPGSKNSIGFSYKTHNRRLFDGTSEERLDLASLRVYQRIQDDSFAIGKTA